jgi:hypothetical protein
MQRPFELTPCQYLTREANEQGLCLRCGTWSGSTNPGVARARCASCGTHAVHGVEQALLLGAIQIRR